MDLLLFVTITVTIFCALGLAVSAVLSFTKRTASRRVQTVIAGAKSKAVVIPASSSIKKRAVDVARWISHRAGMHKDAALIERLERAGFLGTTARDVYIALRIAIPVIGIIAGSLSPWNRFFCILVLGAVGYLLPDIALGRMVATRRERLRLALPDAVDLLVICVDAGLGMDQAMLRVAQELGKAHPDLQQELLRINREQRAGKLRLDAWESMAKRNKVPEIDAFVNMLTQTERFGTPIARALSNFGDNIRQKRRQRAEELAAQTTVKIIFPLVLCIFPSIFIVLIGPAGIVVSHGLKISN
jgi:tight adherence protein C